MSPEVEEAFFELRKYMFRELYNNPIAKGEEGKAEEIVKMLYLYYMDHPDVMTAEFTGMLEAGEKKEIVICDYIAGMTDNYAVRKFQEIFLPKSWTRI